VSLVFDVTNRKSFEELEEWIHDFLDKSGLHDKSLPQPLPFFIVGNKVDCDESAREVSTEEARDWVAQLSRDETLKVIHGVQYLETSAQTGDGVTELFEGSVVQCLKNAAAGSDYAERNIIVVPRTT
jgi:GTPase SAR1 family protein